MGQTALKTPESRMKWVFSGVTDCGNLGVRKNRLRKPNPEKDPHCGALWLDRRRARRRSFILYEKRTGQNRPKTGATPRRVRAWGWDASRASGGAHIAEHAPTQGNERGTALLIEAVPFHLTRAILWYFLRLLYLGDIFR